MKRDQLTKIKAIEAMRKNVAKISPETTVSELNELMILEKHEEVIVVNSADQIIGIITKNDLVKNLARGIDKNTVVKYIMTPNVICMPPDKDLVELRDEMRKAGVGRAPVVDKENNILGILTVKSICDGFSGRLEEVVNYLYDILNGLEDCILAADPMGNILFTNRSAEDEFNITAAKQIINNILPKNIAEQILNSGVNIRNMKLILSSKQFLLNTYNLHYHEKPYGIIINLRDITDIKVLTDELDKTNIRLKYLEEKVESLNADQSIFGKICTENSQMKKVLEVSKRIANTTATILITGESGTGKEVLAKSIYEASDRKNMPFITINCGAIPHNLLESELFGYEQGAFTGANKYGKTGLLELADGGTVFLDEIGELPLDMQVKLLRFIEDRIFYRVGGTIPIKVDVRVIAATNRDLEKMIKENEFRQDLYYRINVIKLDIPPLRHRKEDIPCLINRFIDEFCRIHKKIVEEIDKQVLKLLLDYSWNGNIRELKNVVERMVILAQDNKVVLEDLPGYLIGSVQSNSFTPGRLDVVLKDIERNTIVSLMKKYNGNKTKVARELNIPRPTLYYKLKNLGIYE